MAKNLWLKEFNPSDNFTWRRNCGEYAMGDKVVNKNFTVRRLQQLYNSRIIVATEVWNEFVGPSPADNARVVEDSAPVSDAGDNLVELRNSLESHGVKVDKRWGEARLLEELEKVTNPVKLPGM